MRVPEFYDHVILSRHRVASVSSRLMGVLQMVSPYADRNTRLRVHNAIMADATFCCEVVNVYVAAGGADGRLRLIGLALASKGADHWRRTPAGQEQLQWLQDTQQSEADAIQHYREWRAANDAKLDAARAEAERLRAAGKAQTAVFQKPASSQDRPKA